jgi:hypothetical protein
MRSFWARFSPMAGERVAAFARDEVGRRAIDRLEWAVPIVSTNTSEAGMTGQRQSLRA